MLDNCREALKGLFKIDFPLTLCAVAECSEKLWRRKKKSQLQHILAFLPASQPVSLSHPLSLPETTTCLFMQETNFSLSLSDADVEIKHWSSARHDRLSDVHVVTERL